MSGADSSAAKKNSEEEMCIRDRIMDIYIESSVAAEDRIRMHQMMDFEKICQRLTRIPQLMVHYRVRRSNGRIEYFLSLIHI